MAIVPDPSSGLKCLSLALESKCTTSVVCSDRGEILASAGEVSGPLRSRLLFPRRAMTGSEVWRGRTGPSPSGCVSLSVAMPCARNGGDVSVLGDCLEMPSSEVCSVASWDPEAKSFTGTFHQAGQLLSNVGKRAQR